MASTALKPNPHQYDVEAKTPADILASLLDGLLASRRSVRSFAPTTVPRAAIESILRAAAHAPSNSNTQPWKVDILIGDAKKSLTAAILEEHRRDSTMPSGHFPTSLPIENRERQIAFGGLLYGAYGIGKEDRTAATRQLATNYNFYGAPVGMIVSIDNSLLRHSWLDCGIFLQSLMLAAHARGYGTCPQVVFAKHEPTIIRELDLPANRSVVCGISLGVPDRNAPINAVTYPREPLESFCTFHGDPAPANAKGEG